jgi:hypothetical protein
MSRMWSFCSFDYSRWQSIFGGGAEDAERSVVESVTWETEIYGTKVYEDLDAAVRIARQIVKSGFSYEGLSPAEAIILDEIVMGFFCDEGLKDCLGFDYESPDFLHLSWVKELISCGDGARLPFLNLLTAGRRFNGKGAPDQDFQYLILIPDEVSQFRSEVLSLLESPAPRPDPELRLLMRERLLAVLESVIAKNRCLAGRHC